MADSLIANANGKYYEGLSILIGKPNQVKVIVEDEMDVSFWHDVLCSVTSSKTFDITPYQYTSAGLSDLAKGKLHILHLARNSQLGKNFLGCVDSDYDYLLSGTSSDGQLMNANPFLLQTYAYSIENLFCCPETLESICVKANKVIPYFNFIELMRNISNIIYPLLIWSLYLQSKGIHEFNPTHWTNIFSCNKNISTHCSEDILLSLKDRVQEAIVNIVLNHRQEIETRKKFEDDLVEHYEINADNCYLFVRGHDIHKYILNVFLKGIQTESRKRHITAIRASGANSDVISNNLSHYSKTTIETEVLFNSNYGYKDYCPFLFEKIKRDIQCIS